MNRPKLIVALILCGLAPVDAGAQVKVTEDNFLARTTADLVALCSSQPGDRYYTAAQNFCQGFAVGVYRTIDAEQSGRRVRLFCAPAVMPTRNEAIANFTGWAEASPARLQMPPVDGIAAYLTERLPCQTARQ